MKGPNSFDGHQARVIDSIGETSDGLFLYQVKVGGEIWKAKSKRRLASGDLVKVEGQEKEEMILILM